MGSRVVATYLNGKLAYAAKSKDSASVVAAAHAYTSQGFVAGGVSVNAGKITGVGNNLTVPRGAQIKHFENAYIVPGMLDCQIALGIGGTLSDQIGLNTKIGELLARDDDQMARRPPGRRDHGLVEFDASCPALYSRSS